MDFLHWSAVSENKITCLKKLNGLTGNSGNSCRKGFNLVATCRGILDAQVETRQSSIWEKPMFSNERKIQAASSITERFLG
jgi:hypothetical protein